ncbi:Ff.00g090700.m01.CDS01 [Fusarium sp. VM40]|nr:Ff.00g090700.m01.CDS01 [Fusarium sp. VM40]
MLQSPSTSAPAIATVADGVDKTRKVRRKRKADTQDNERLSKRLSLLNLERNGNKLYVPVEEPSTSIPPTVASSSDVSSNLPVSDETMQLDDSKHKVYIYNMDDELSSDSETEDSGKLVFLPDIEKHLRANRIPPSVLANSEGELAGMQVVLYSDPKSLTVPEDKDIVRKAIIESRRRTRELQRLEREGKIEPPTIQDNTANNAIDTGTNDDPDAMDLD